MRRLSSSKIFSFFDKEDGRYSSNPKIRGGAGHEVKTYFELAKKIAELQFRNRDLLLLFRGQKHDYQTTQSNSMLKASIFRHEDGKLPSDETMQKRFATLEDAEQLLEEEYDRAKLLGKEEVRRKSAIRWAILQHYDVCKTPLLDVTHSLRTAASFASSGNQSGLGFVYVFAVPNLSGAITISSEADLQTIRLSSACPPSAVRAHIQEGYLLGEYPEIDGFRRFKKYEMYELDFGRRLVAKFRFNPDTFWSSQNYPPVPDEALYPGTHRDVLLTVTQMTKNRLEGVH